MRGAKVVKTKLSRRLRRDSTHAELLLWNRIRLRAIGGHKIVRQESIGPFIVDFICREQRLIIEVDGGQHATDKRDAIREQWLTNHRYRVLRFWNNEVIQNMNGVLETIAAALDAETPPHPALAFGEDRPLPASGER